MVFVRFDSFTSLYNYLQNSCMRICVHAFSNISIYMLAREGGRKGGEEGREGWGEL